MVRQIRTQVIAYVEVRGKPWQLVRDDDFGRYWIEWKKDDGVGRWVRYGMKVWDRWEDAWDAFWSIAIPHQVQCHLIAKAKATEVA